MLAVYGGAAALLLLAAGWLCLDAVQAAVRRQRALHKLPSPATGLLGHLQMLRPDLHRFMRNTAKQLGGVYRLRVLWQQLVVVTDAHAIHQVLGSTEALDKALEPSSDLLLAQRKGHPTLFSSSTSSAYWRFIRKGIAPAFIQKNIKNGFGDVARIFTQVSSQLDELRPDDGIDMHNVFMRISMDVTGLVGFSKDYGTTRDLADTTSDAALDTLKSAMLELYRQTLNPARKFNLFNKDVRGSARLFKSFQQDMRDLVAEVKARGPPAEDDVTVAAHLMRLRDPVTNQPLADDLLASEFAVIYAAGLESAANALTWTIYLISQHPEVEAKLLAELEKRGFLSRPGQPAAAKMQYSDLHELPYLAMVCKEAMRVRPVASSGTTRRAARDLKLCGHLVPKGSLLVCPFDAAHRLPANFGPDADDFLPERWEEPSAEFMPAKTGGRGAQAEPGRAVKRFLAFSTGPRQCVGQSLARMLHDLGVAMLCSRFHFSLDPRMGGPEGVDRCEINRLTLQPENGLWMNVRPHVPLVPRELLPEP